MRRLALAAVVLVLAAAGTARGADPRARRKAALLARAGEARYRLALLREEREESQRELATALRALEEARSLDPANLRALAYLGLARLEAARVPTPQGHDGPDFDPPGFRSACGPLEELFRLVGDWADPQTRALLKDVVGALDGALRRPASNPTVVYIAAARWWGQWRERVAKAADAAPPAGEALALVETLRASPLAWERESAAEKLSRRKGKPQPGVAEALARALREDASPWVRAAAAKAFAKLKPEGWDIRLAEALRNDGSVFVRRTCVKGFGSIHVSLSPPKRPLDKAVRAALVSALLSDTPRVAAVAAGTLGKFEEAEEELLQALESPSSIVRGVASGSLSSFARSKKVLDRLVELLSDKRPEIRLVAIRAMPPARDVSEQARQEIVERFADPDPLVRAAAAHKFYGPNGLSAEVRARIEKLLDDDDPRVRLDAAWVLGKANDAARKVLESLKHSRVPTGAVGSSTVGRRARTILGELLETDIEGFLLDRLRWLDE